MVKVIGYSIRKSSKDGKEREFIVLELQGGVELVQSSETGKFYATVRKTTITATFGEETAKALVGSNYPGSIIRVQVNPYEYVIPDTGEMIKLAHSYQYSPEEAAIFQTVSKADEMITI